MRFNLNYKVKVKLTDAGRKILKDRHEAMNVAFSGLFGEYQPPKEDAEGWSEWQLWCLMEQLGKYVHIGIGGPMETEIELVEPFR